MFKRLKRLLTLTRLLKELPNAQQQVEGPVLLVDSSNLLEQDLEPAQAVTSEQDLDCTHLFWPFLMLPEHSQRPHLGWSSKAAEL